ncbi:Excinuclease ABC subunit C [Candidatus Bartonella washoeensis]|nr:Excinuclease ABC subunit C [Bartonella washoeensis]
MFVYGPRSRANQTINVLPTCLLLRTCTDSVFENRTRRVALSNQRCSAPCTHQISDSAYRELVREAKAFLSGKANLLKRIWFKLCKSRRNFDFEQAATYRDRLRRFLIYKAIKVLILKGRRSRCIAIAQQGAMTCIQVFFFRMGQNWGNRSYFPKADPSFSRTEILTSSCPIL